jgi:hypothetical protein
MRLTWKDGVTTLLAIATVVVALAVVQDWGWPLLGSYRAGAVVLLAVGLGMCALGGSTVQRSEARGPYFATMSMLGLFALGFAIWTLIADAEGPFLGLAITSILMWLVSTLHHAVGYRPPAYGARSARV